MSAREASGLAAPQAEQAVLGALLLENGCIDRIPDLRPDHFHDPQHRLAFEVIHAELLAGHPVDVVSAFERVCVRGWVDGALAYLNQLAQCVPSAASVERHAGLVIDCAKARDLQRVGQAVTQVAADTSLPIELRIERAQAELMALTQASAAREPRSFSQMAIGLIERIQARCDGEARMFPTGLTELDDLLGGGLRPGSLAIVAARPSMGKTALALTMAMSQSQRLGVGFLSMEMSEAELTDRAAAMVGRLDMGDLQRPQAVNGGEFWERLTEVCEGATGYRLWVDDQDGLTIQQLLAKARALHRRQKIDVLFVDYIQLMAGTDSRQPRAYQLEEVSRGLKGLAKSLDIAVVALAQVQRRAEGGVPGLADLKDSGAIEQDADVVAFIHRPIAVNPELGEDWKRYGLLRVAKNRQGRTGDVHLAYIGEQTRFSSWSGPAPAVSPAMTHRGGKG